MATTILFLFPSFRPGCCLFECSGVDTFSEVLWSLGKLLSMALWSARGVTTMTSSYTWPMPRVRDSRNMCAAMACKLESESSLMLTLRSPVPGLEPSPCEFFVQSSMIMFPDEVNKVITQSFLATCSVSCPLAHWWPSAILSLAEAEQENRGRPFASNWAPASTEQTVAPTGLMVWPLLRQEAWPVPPHKVESILPASCPNQSGCSWATRILNLYRGASSAAVTAVSFFFFLLGSFVALGGFRLSASGDTKI